MQRTKCIDDIHAPFAGHYQFHRFFLIKGVVKDNAFQPWKPGGVPIVQIGFKDYSIRAFARNRKAFDQLIRSCTPRASAIDNSPALLPPAEVAIELAVGDMHDAELRKDASVWFWKDESHGLRIDDFQS